MMFKPIICALTVNFAICAGVTQAEKNNSSQLVFEVECATPEVLEGCPIVLKVMVRNVGTEDIQSVFDVTRQSELSEATNLQLEDGDGRVYKLFYRGGPNVHRTRAPGRIYKLAPQVSVRVDRVVPTVWWGREARGSEYTYRFVPPGTYTGRVRVVIDQDLAVSAEAFSIRILEPSGEEIDARQLLRIEDVDFLSGGEPLRSTQEGGGARPRSFVRLPDNLQELLGQFPRSQYADWIRYWTLYHHGPVDDALQYARNHADFPLADNLMLRMAEGLFNNRQFDRSRKVVAEMSRTFPNGDTRAALEVLQRKLTDKPQ